MGAEQTLAWTLNRAASQYSSAIATVDRGTGETRTWAEVSERVESVASGLLTFDLSPGDRVGVLMLNSSRHFELWFAIPAAGMVMNDLNYRLATEELRFICDDSDVKVLFVDDAFLDVGRELVSLVDSLSTLVWVGVGESPPDGCIAYDGLARTPLGELPVQDHADLAAIFYTGGTTGLPKGAMLTHRNLASNALHGMAAMGITSRDIYLHAGPQFHLADGSMTYAVTWAGGRHVFVPSFEPAGTVAALSEENCTLTLLVPTMLNMVLGSGTLETADLSSLRALMYGASPMPGEIQRQVAEGFGCELYQLYGMTEASPIATCMDGHDHRRGMAGEEPFASRLRSAGAPVAGVKCEVRRADNTICDVEEPGEVFIQGPNIMAGYWNRPEETAHALVDGWYRTGDIAWRDADGYIYVVDRAKDMIISGGENIYTSEVENAIYQHPSVVEAAVFGIPDEKFGEMVHAEIVVQSGEAVDEANIIAHCRDHIAGYKVPRSVRLRGTDAPLPKSGAGKILKRELRESFWEGHARRVG